MIFWKITKISLSSLFSSLRLLSHCLQKFEKSGKKLKLKIETSREQEIEEREDFEKLWHRQNCVAKLQFDDEGVDTEVSLSLSLTFFSKNFRVVHVSEITTTTDVGGTDLRNARYGHC